MSKPSSVAWMAISLSLHHKWDVMFLFPSGSIKDQSDLQNLHSCVELIRAKSHLHGNISVTIFLAVARIALPKKTVIGLVFQQRQTAENEHSARSIWNTENMDQTHTRFLKTPTFPHPMSYISSTVAQIWVWIIKILNGLHLGCVSRYIRLLPKTWNPLSFLSDSSIPSQPHILTGNVRLSSEDCVLELVGHHYEFIVGRPVDGDCVIGSRAQLFPYARGTWSCRG